MSRTARGSEHDPDLGRGDQADGVGRPADAHACGALGCRRTEELRRVIHDDGRERVLCPTHARYFVGGSA